jgi:hypothetical protein
MSEFGFGLDDDGDFSSVDYESYGTAGIGADDFGMDLADFSGSGTDESEYAYSGQINEADPFVADHDGQADSVQAQGGAPPVDTDHDGQADSVQTRAGAPPVDTDHDGQADSVQTRAGAQA